jgi:hypothetical protein
LRPPAACHLNVNLQLFQRRVYHHTDPSRVADPALRAWVIQSALLAGQLDRLNSESRCHRRTAFELLSLGVSTRSHRAWLCGILMSAPSSKYKTR